MPATTIHSQKGLVITMFNMTDVGRRISVFRKNAGLTQMELANRLGISYQAVSNWERGISMPDISNLSALAEILSVSIDEIIADKKISAILEHNGDNVENETLTIDEFNAVSPLLPAEKNIKLISDIKAEEEVTDGGNVFVTSSGVLNKEINISSLGLTAEELEAYARSAYESGNVAIFAVLRKYLPPEVLENFARDAFEAGNTAIFAIVRKHLSAEKQKKFLEEAVSRGKVALASILIHSLTDSDKKDEDD